MKRGKQTSEAQEMVAGGAEGVEAEDCGRGSMRRCRQRQAEEDRAYVPLLSDEYDVEDDDDEYCMDAEEGCSSKAGTKKGKKQKAQERAPCKDLAEAPVLLGRCARADLGEDEVFASPLGGRDEERGDSQLNQDLTTFMCMPEHLIMQKLHDGTPMKLEEIMALLPEVSLSYCGSHPCVRAVQLLEGRRISCCLSYSMLVCRTRGWLYLLLPSP
jgi:hypothetical protein